MAFPPPPVTFPATRLSSFDVSGFAPIRLIISRGRCFVFIRATQDLPCSWSQQAFRLRLRTYQTVAFRSFRPRTIASPHPFHLPVPVKMPVSNSDCENDFTDYFPLVNRKNRVSPLFYRGFLWKRLWKNCGNPVDILWKIGQVFLISDFKKIFTSCGKSTKKIFFFLKKPWFSVWKVFCVGKIRQVDDLKVRKGCLHPLLK